MGYLDRTATQELLELLAPLMQGEGERRALLLEALGSGCPVLDRIDYGGAVHPFLLNMIDTLASAGEIEPGTTALWALLESARRQVGLDIQKRIDDLKPLLGTSAPKTTRPATAAPVAQPLHLKVFLASPGDVAEERTLALRVLEQLQYDPLLRGRITVEIVAWDQPGSGAPMLATETPQTSIAQSLGRPSECDIAVVVLWSRMGTPLPGEWKKPDGTPYLSGTEWEYLDALQAAEQHGKPDILVYRRNEEPLFAPSDPAFMAKYEQWQQVEQFFAAFRLPDGSIQRGYNPYDTPDDFHQQLNRHLRELVRRRLDAYTRTPVTESAAPTVATPDAQVTAPLWQGSPFPGLHAFSAKDAPIFFGRGRETGELFHRLTEADNRFIAVVGASGSGKSSLVAAGLLPRLKDNAQSAAWMPVRFTPGTGGNPFSALSEALATALKGRRASDLETRLCAGSDTLDNLVGDLLKDNNADAELLLFVDQFEELFTLVDKARRGPFIRWLTAAARTPRLRVVLTLRADFYAHCVEWQELAELLRTGSYPLAAPGLGALYEMITGPAERAGLTFEDGLVAQLLEDTGTEPGALALLAFALAELYDQRTDAGNLTWDAYRRFDGVQGAIAQRAEAIYKSLDADEATLGAVFRELVEVDERGTATRRRAPLGRVQRSDTAKALVDALTQGRLLVQDSDKNQQAVVEVAHEALFRNWKTLTEWIENTADELRLLRQIKHAALDWIKHGKSEAYLWPQERLEPAWAAVKSLDPELDEVTSEFLRPEQDRLLAEVDNPSTDHKRRSDIGERLAVIGDPRPGVGLREDGLPDIVWCEVPAGKVTLEGGAGTFQVQRCWIAKYAVTYLQYRCFLKAPDGYQNEKIWKGLERESDAWVQNRKFGNHPADNINWYDAVAFCRWLNEKLADEIRERLGENHVIRLPTEWEWQQAATGGDPKQEYPWPGGWDSSRTNTYESGLSRTTAVGMYPEGASPVGALDMAGNVWDWCLNEYEKPKKTDLSGSARRVVRGGSWNNLLDYARAAFRYRNFPDYRLNHQGFRVVCSSPIF